MRTRAAGVPMVDDVTLKAWFEKEVFPLEAALTRFIRRNWRNEADVADLRQEIYARVYQAAREHLPQQPKPFVFTTAKNHLINCAKRAQIVSFDHVADLDALNVAIDVFTPERHLTARDELRRLKEGIDRLPPRCREVVILRKIEGLSIRDAATRMNVGVDTVEQQLVHGMRALADFMLGGTGKVRRHNSGRKTMKEGGQ